MLRIAPRVALPLLNISHIKGHKGHHFENCLFVQLAVYIWPISGLYLDLLGLVAIFFFLSSPFNFYISFYISFTFFPFTFP